MVRRATRAGLFLLLIAGMIGAVAGTASAGSEVRHGREYAARGSRIAGGGNNPDMTNHGGPIMNAAVVHAIYWGTSWSNSSFVSDKESGLATLYSGLGASQYGTTTTEYTSSNGRVLSGGVTNQTASVDTSAGPTSPPSTAQIVAEVAKEISNPVSNGFYPVYTDLKRGTAGYCAWHDTGTANGVQVQVAFFFNLDGDSGCDPQDSNTIHSQGLEALANVSGHEFSEAVTDPHLNAWYDRRGYENADKCAWTFSGWESIGGTQWKIQGNWSNAANDNGKTGYANGGCIV